MSEFEKRRHMTHPYQRAHAAGIHDEIPDLAECAGRLFGCWIHDPLAHR